MIKREKYLKDIREFYDSDLIKIITGIRRCGKSTILKEIINEISKKTNDIIFIDFEEASNLYLMPDDMSLINYVYENRKSDFTYVFLDEVQRVKNWPSAVRTLRLKNISVFISGSNSKLLSREFTKELSGRFVSFRVRPFVYKELCEYAKELKKEISITDYIIWGGFPKRLEFDSLNAQKTYINELNDTIILNDIISRYNIRKVEVFKSIVNFIMLSNSRACSVRSITNYIKTNGLPCSVATVSKYISYLEEAFVIELVQEYSNKIKAKLGYYNKIYLEDVSLNSIRVTNSKYDLTHNFENIVYNELIYMGYNVSVYKKGQQEIDFYANKDNKSYLIQVAYSIVDEKTYEREFSLFNKLDNSNQKIIITNDELDYSTSSVRHIKFKDFLMMKDL